MDIATVGNVKWRTVLRHSLKYPIFSKALTEKYDILQTNYCSVMVELEEVI